MLSSQLKLLRLVLLERPDIWHFHDPENLPLAILLSSLGQVVVWDAHEDYLGQMVDAGSVKKWVPATLAPMVGFAVRLLLTQADAASAGVVAATPTIAERYRNRNTVLVGNEARIEDFRNCIPNFSAKNALFTGSPSTEHCFPEIVSGVAAIPDLTLTVAGRPPQAHMKALAEQALGERVHFVGWLNRDELRATMSGATIGFVTYEDTEANSKALGNKVFEFAAAGLPIVTTPRSLVADAIGQGAFGVVAKGFAAADLEEALRSAVGSEEEWAAMSGRGREWAVEHGNYEASERRLIDLYTRLSNPA